jgi:pyruvate/2-oxoglutarate dehydrogenase complex dihydrolipoamide dehydrogenase (E3) component
MDRYDAIVIGAGQSGPPLAVRLAQAGQHVAIVERRELGGTCVNNGCIPTKTMIASARAAWVARRAAEWGVQIEGAVRVDMKAVKARKDAVVDESRRGLQSWIDSTERLELIRGEARFETVRRIRVGERVLEAERFFIDTGASPFVPDLPGLNDVPYLTNLGMMELDVAPEHLIILGGSYIGLEFGQMFRRFGSRVSIVERAPRLIAREDADVSQGLLELMQAEQIEVRLDADARSVRRDGAGVALELGSGEVLRGSHLLLALGRVPNTAALNLEAIGVRVGPRGHIEVDDTLRSSQPQIWALGEVNGRGQFTHTSYNDYEIVAGNLLDGETRRVTDRILIYGLFTDPPLGRVGMTEHEARQSGRKVLLGTRPMSRVGRARERGETRGFIKILADADSKQLLGATIFGIEGDEAVHCIADLMYAGAPYTALQRAVHTHPTVSELLPTVAGEMRPLAS